jgi:hypothetical protein
MAYSSAKPSNIQIRKPETNEKKIFQGGKARDTKAKKSKKEDGLFTETEGKIKEGGLRRALKIKTDGEPLTKKELSPLLKHDNEKTFQFRGNSIKMTDKLKKQIRLDLNMMKS